jgi:hypothetical protein
MRAALSWQFLTCFGPVLVLQQLVQLVEAALLLCDLDRRPVAIALCVRARVREER